MGGETKDKEGKVLNEGTSICCMCGSSNVETENKEHTFPYGVGKAQVELSATVPVRVCKSCGFQFMDSLGGEACHDAVCKHLRVMTPKQIRALRKMHNLTQADFAKITGLGEATLSRWERGVVVQNQACDNYLYLLRLPANLERIRTRNEESDQEGDAAAPVQRSTFRVLKLSEELEKRSSAFSLRQLEPERPAKCM